MIQTAKTNQRNVSDIVTAKTTLEGDGFTVHRPFPNYAVRDFDPFLLLDEMGPVILEKEEAKGASAHPHRGFETVTYVIDGSFEHKDSKGHSGKLHSGDVQWMTAGSGIVHSEMPEKEFAQKGGRLHGFQLWINLPKKDKMTKPHYQEIASKQIPVAQSKDDKIKVKVIAGQSMGKKAVIDTKTPITYLHFSLQPGAHVLQEIPNNYNAFAYIAHGQGLFGANQKLAKKAQAVFFDNNGNEIIFSNPNNATESLELLLLGGIPIGEPVKRYGPFVMNTEEELQQAIKDFQNEMMGRIDF